jgi:hypothetical protein
MPELGVQKRPTSQLPSSFSPFQTWTLTSVSPSISREKRGTESCEEDVLTRDVLYF